MNMQAIMAKAQKMQKDITNKKEEIDKTIFEGKSEWVTVTFNGKRELQSLKITKEGIIDEDDKEVLEDMINIAIKDAFKKIEKEIDNKLGAYRSAMNGFF